MPPPPTLINRIVRTAAWGAVGVGGLALAGTVATAAVAGAAYAGWRRNSGFELRGKVVLVTGGSRGLGWAVAREYLRSGCRVAICARGREELERAASELRAWGDVLPVVGDLTDATAPEAAVAAVRAHWGEVEVLVHVAGTLQLGNWDQMDDADFQRAMDLHCWAALRLARAVLPAMIARGAGRIVNVSSIGGLIAAPRMLPYTASKFALTGLSQGLAVEVRRHGVRVSCVCPFLTRTGSQKHIHVKPGREREFERFATLGNLPLLTQSAARAARGIVRASRRGTPLVVLSLPGRLAALAHGVAPATVTTATAIFS